MYRTVASYRKKIVAVVWRMNIQGPVKNKTKRDLNRYTETRHRQKNPEPGEDLYTFMCFA